LAPKCFALGEMMLNKGRYAVKWIYLKVVAAMFGDWSKPPSVNRQRHMRGRRLNDDVVLRRLFTLHYCTIVAVSATSDTAGKFAIVQASRQRAGW